MKYSIYIFAILSIFAFSSFFHHDEALKLSADSQLKIKGSSNINEFECSYQFNNRNTNYYHIISGNKNKAPEIKNLEIIIPVNNCDCGNIFLNQDFKNTLNADEHPNFSIFIKSFSFSNNDKSKTNVDADIRLSGIEKSKTILYSTSYEERSNAYVLKGETNVNLHEFNLKPKNRFFGKLKVDEKVKIDFLLKFVKN